MRILSVSEFARYCEEKRPKSYIYSTENQPNSFSATLRIDMRFEKMFACVNPNRLCFYNNKHHEFTLTRIKQVNLFDEEDGIGTIFKIICNENGENRTYVWLMR